MPFDPFYTPDEFEDDKETHQPPPPPPPPPEVEPDSLFAWAKRHAWSLAIGGGVILYLLVFVLTRENLSLVARLWLKDKDRGAPRQTEVVKLRPRKGEGRGALFSFGPSASVTGDYQEELERALLKAVTIKGKLRRGERVIRALVRNGLARKEAERLVASFESKGVFSFRRAQPGNTFLVRMSPEGDRAYYFEYHFGRRITLVAMRKKDGFDVRKVVKPITTRLLGVVLVVGQGGLGKAAEDAGQDRSLAAKVAVLIEDEIPTRRLARGDRFELLVERTFVGREPARYGRILAARIYTRLKGNYEIFYFVQKGLGGSYYTGDGLGFFRVFMPRPVEGEAPYDSDPYHEEGVLFPSGKGALVRSVGRGTIKWIGWRKSWGKSVIVEHPGGYETHYYYLSRLARLRKGDSVEKKSVLGRAGYPVLNPALTGVGFAAYHKGKYVTPTELARLRESSIEPELFPEFRKTVSDCRNLLKSLKKFKHSSSLTFQSPTINAIYPWDRKRGGRK